MSTTYKAILWKVNKSGLRAVHIRITAARRHAYLASGVAVAEKFWNANADPVKANWVRATHPDAAIFNARLRDLLRDVQELALGGTPYTSAEIQQRVAEKNGLRRGTSGVELIEQGSWEASKAARQLDFLVYFADEVKRRAVAGHPRSVEKLASILHKIRVYLAPPRDLAEPTAEWLARLEALTLPFAELTPRWVRDYADYLGTLGNKDSTVSSELTFIKTIVRRAIEDGRIEEGQNPFKRMRLSEPAPTVKLKLSREQVARMEALPTPPPARGLRRFTSMQLAREVWLLQYYLLGARVGDVLTLRWRDVQEQRVTFTEHKTHKVKVAPRHERLDLLLTRLQVLGEKQPPRPQDFVVPALQADQPYAQFPAELDWHLLSKLAPYRPTWLLLLKRIEAATATVNAGLKQLAPLLGVPPKALTSHTARHSFANEGRLSGIPASHMRDMLNHYSVAQTETYFGQLEKEDVNEWALQVYK